VLNGTPEIPEWEPYDGRGLTGDAGGEDRDVAGGAYGTTVLAEGVAELDIAYFGPPEGTPVGLPPGEVEGEWQPEWLDRQDLPTAVRIHLTTAARDWPDLVVTMASSETRYARQRRTQTSAGP
jgi:general secretion pathway protein J